MRHFHADMVESLQPTAYAISFLMYALASITTGLRIYSRKCIIESFGWDDWWMISVLVYNTGQQALFCMSLYYGGGLPVDTIAQKDIATILKLLFAAEIFYIWMHFAIKTGFLLFYLRLVNKPSFLYSVYATMLLNFLVAVALWLLYCLRCRPLPAFWNPGAYRDATCVETAVTYYLPAALNILTDIIILVLPIPPLWRMQAPVCRRIEVIAVVTFGGAAVIVACLRVIVLHEFVVNPDFTYILGSMVIVSAVELNVAIMAANAPSLKAVWLKHSSGSLDGYLASTRLSSVQRSSLAVPVSSVSRRRAVSASAYDDSLPESSSMRNLVSRTESRED
ncbi:hypothetical protein BJX61DRAFT_540203 [Aspergillus egyptiacus]|nr:hypothetical protein BJX61DRAFT_540203 [Aspergillus egyptiacus]